MNFWVLLFSLALSIATSLLFGLAPALAILRVDLAESLKEGSRGSIPRRRVLRQSLVAFEIAASLILLIGAGLLARSFAKRFWWKRWRRVNQVGRLPPFAVRRQ